MTKTPETWADVRTQGALHRRADQVADFVRHVAGLETPDEYDQRTDGDGMSGDDAVDTLGSLVVWARGLQQPDPAQPADNATGARLVGVEGLGDKAISLDDALTAARVIGMVTLALKSTTYGLTAEQVKAIAVGAANVFIDTVEGHGVMPEAPAPEGGAVFLCDQCNGDGYIYPNGIGDGHNHQDVCPSCGGAGGFDPNAPAIATREVAPACEMCNGRGEVGGPTGQTPESFDYVTERCPDCGGTGKVEAPAEAGREAIGKLIVAFMDERNGGDHRHRSMKAADAVLSVLRAHPQAREDAQPVWVDGVPTKHHAKEWFIAETTFGDRVVLTALPEEYAYDFKTADETYIKADRIKRWMPFPDSQYLFPHPATDALRVAVEALREVSALRSNGHGDEWESGFTQGTARAAGIADRALAALRSEQKGGA